MDLLQATARLEANANAFRGLLDGVSDEQARWQPAPGKWSLLEVINHLADEERLDFRTRLDLTLHRPDEDWPPIDPLRWASEREYNRRDLGESVERFLVERRASLAWLRGLQAPDWEASRTHPAAGTIRAGDLLVAWLAHDLIHLRQLARLHFEFLAARSGPYSTEYAGRW